MKTLIKTAFAALAIALPMFAAQQADAGHGHYQSSGFGNYGANSYRYASGPYVQRSNFNYSQPIYHAPSVHLDRVYHPTSTHWTPSQGLHTHGHVDTVPHYTPGHFDSLHNGHIDGNSQFHN